MKTAPHARLVALPNLLGLHDCVAVALPCLPEPGCSISSTVTNNSQHPDCATAVMLSQYITVRDVGQSGSLVLSMCRGPAQLRPDAQLMFRGSVAPCVLSAVA